MLTMTVLISTPNVVSGGRQRAQQAQPYPTIICPIGDRHKVKRRLFYLKVLYA